MSLINRLLAQTSITKSILDVTKKLTLITEQPSRGLIRRGIYVDLLIEKPKIGTGKAFRR